MSNGSNCGYIRMRHNEQIIGSNLCVCSTFCTNRNDLLKCYNMYAFVELLEYNILISKMISVDWSSRITKNHKKQRLMKSTI